MIRFDIPERGVIELHHAVFDLNGTLATDGTFIPGIPDRLQQLGTLLEVHILTAGTPGNIAEFEQTLGRAFHLITHGDEKRRYVEQLGPQTVVAFGNGTNDIGMLRVAAIGIAILGTEGLSMSALRTTDVLVASPLDAIDLVLSPKRLLATLRT